MNATAVTLSTDRTVLNVYEDVELDDLEFDPDFEGKGASGRFLYLCPCGDLFEIALGDMLRYGTQIAECPSCTLKIRVAYTVEDLRKFVA